MCSTGGVTRELPGWQLSDDAVEHALAQLDGDEARLAARRAELLHEAQVRSLNTRTRACTMDRWLRDRYHWSTALAGRRLRETQSFLGQPAVHSALAWGRVTVEQAVVIADTLEQVDALDRVSDPERADAADLLLDQAAALCPRELQIAGRDLVEHLTRTPSVDTDQDAEAVAREQAAAADARQPAHPPPP